MEGVVEHLRFYQIAAVLGRGKRECNGWLGVVILPRKKTTVGLTFREYERLPKSVIKGNILGIINPIRDEDINAGNRYLRRQCPR